MEYYGQDQFQNIVPHLPRQPKWLILGGPADGNEAQYALNLWPDLQVVGVEPCIDTGVWQIDKGEWPAHHPLIMAALSDKPGEAYIYQMPGMPRNATLVKDADFKVPPSKTRVETVTIDSLDAQYGPFNDTILWLDIEGWELEALQGAERVLSRGAVILVNVELMSPFEAKNEQVEALLKRHGFSATKDWNDSATCRDRIFVRKWS